MELWSVGWLVVARLQRPGDWDLVFWRFSAPINGIGVRAWSLVFGFWLAGAFFRPWRD
jgi:hypothetical protein